MCRLLISLKTNVIYTLHTIAPTKFATILLCSTHQWCLRVNLCFVINHPPFAPPLCAPFFKVLNSRGKTHYVKYLKPIFFHDTSERKYQLKKLSHQFHTEPFIFSFPFVVFHYIYSRNWCHSWAFNIFIRLIRSLSKPIRVGFRIREQVCGQGKIPEPHTYH